MVNLINLRHDKDPSVMTPSFILLVSIRFCNTSVILPTGVE